MFDLKPVFCDACIEGFFDEDDDGIPCADDIGLPRVEWMTDDPD